MRMMKYIRQDAKRLMRLCLVDGIPDATRTRVVVTGLAQSQRRDRYALLAHFHRLLEQQVARHLATIESAVALPGDLLARVEAGLTSAYGKGLQISYKQQPALIGGMRVQVGSDVYDGSVRAKLAALEARL